LAQDFSSSRDRKETVATSALDPVIVPEKLVQLEGEARETKVFVKFEFQASLRDSLVEDVQILFFCCNQNLVESLHLRGSG
jgi:hypothetical protein